MKVGIIGKASVALAILLTILSVSPDTRAQQAYALPPFAFAYDPQGIDERGMWMLADEEERSIRTSRFLIRDEALVSYLRDVLCRTVGQERCRGVRLYVLRIPEFNASMYPNGMMTVWSGLLLRVQNEAELAAVLGHEFGHFEKRHSVFGFKNKRSTTDVLAWLGLLTPNSAFSTPLVGSVYAFDRKRETEADLISLNYLAASPYPSASAATIWSRLMAEKDATAAGRKQKVSHRYGAGFFASHPTDLARATYLAAEAVKYGDTGDVAREAYRTGIAKWLPLLLDDQVKMNDFGGSEYLLRELAADGWTADLLFARAELYSQRGNPRDYATAADLYRESIAKGYTGAEVHRGLGYALLRTQQTQNAHQALADYLRIKPDAHDASMIRSLISK
jgi:predicted Zn-dependent protease